MQTKQCSCWSSWSAVLGWAGVVALASGCGSQMELGPVANARAVSEIRSAIGGSEAGADAGGAAGPTGTGWATLRGRFIYDGTPPTMPPYQVNKDTATCAPGGHAPPQQTLVVDGGTMGIKNVAIYLRDASRVHDSAKPSEDLVEFDQKECVFLSHVRGILVGQSLDIKNSDPVGHNTKIDGRSNRFNQTIPAGEAIAYKIQREEATPAPVSCSIHPWMSAYLLPRDNGYFAITADDGSFEIANLPAGEELEIQVWHESATGAGGSLVVTTPDAKALKWSNKGRFTIKLEPDEVKELEITVPASAFRG